MTQARERQQGSNPTDLNLPLGGGEQLVIRRRYQVLSILNDFLLGILFLIGSVLFLVDLNTTASWLFTVASALFVARPTIRLTQYFHLGRRSTSEWDF